MGCWLLRSATFVCIIASILKPEICTKKLQTPDSRLQTPHMSIQSTTSCFNYHFVIPLSYNCSSSGSWFLYVCRHLRPMNLFTFVSVALHISLMCRSRDLRVLKAPSRFGASNEAHLGLCYDTSMDFIRSIYEVGRAKNINKSFLSLMTSRSHTYANSICKLSSTVCMICSKETR